jgi:hypothetical protein
MTISMLDRANLFSRISLDCRTFALDDPRQVRAFFEVQLDRFAARGGITTDDILELKRSLKPEAFTKGENLEDALGRAAVEAMAIHFGHRDFKAMVRGVAHGTSAALGASGWIETKDLGLSLLEVCFKGVVGGDDAFLSRLNMRPDLHAPEEGPHPKHPSIPGFEIAVIRDAQGLFVELPSSGDHFRRQATMHADPQASRVRLHYGIGKAGGSESRFADYEKREDTWVPLNGPPRASFEPGTLEHDAFEALLRAARGGSVSEPASKSS